MPNLQPALEVQESRYIDRMACVYGDRTKIETKWLDLVPDPAKTVREHVEDLPEMMLDSLIYVGFYKQAMIRVRHPLNIMPRTGDPEKREETLLGKAIEVPEKKYVVGNSDDFVVFATRQEVLDYEEISPYMRSSLLNLAVNGMWLPEFNDFLPRIPGEPLNVQDFVGGELLRGNTDPDDIDWQP